MTALLHFHWLIFLRLLIQAGFDVNVQDNDGWTPLHAAAHWGVKEACSILAEALCDMDIRNKLVSEPQTKYNNPQKQGQFSLQDLDPIPWQAKCALKLHT